MIITLTYDYHIKQDAWWGAGKAIGKGMKCCAVVVTALTSNVNTMGDREWKRRRRA